MKITLDLEQKEIEYLRNSISDLGMTDKVSISLQLKIANAILDAMEEEKKMV